MRHYLVEQAIKIANSGNISDYYFTPDGKAEKIATFDVLEFLDIEGLRDPQSRRANLSTFLNRIRHLSDEEAGLPSEVRERMCFSILSQYQRKCDSGEDQRAMDDDRLLDSTRQFARNFVTYFDEEVRNNGIPPEVDSLIALRDDPEALSRRLDEEFAQGANELDKQIKKARSKEATYGRCHLRFDKL